MEVVFQYSKVFAVDMVQPAPTTKKIHYQPTHVVESILQEITNRTHFSRTPKPEYLIALSKVLRGPLVRSHLIFDGNTMDKSSPLQLLHQLMSSTERGDSHPSHRSRSHQWHFEVPGSGHFMAPINGGDPITNYPP